AAVRFGPTGAGTGMFIVAMTSEFHPVVFYRWSVADLVGHMMFLPLAAGIRNWRRDLASLSGGRIAELLTVFTVLLLLSVGLYGGFQGDAGRTIGLLFLPVPILLWAAVRFGPTGARTGMFIVAMSAMIFALNGAGPFAGQSPVDSVGSLQAFFIALFLAILTVAVLTRERDAAIAGLQDSHGLLERRVIDRTSELKTSDERFRSLVRHAPVCIYEIETDGSISSMNAAGLSIHGLKDDSDILGESCLRPVSADDRERISGLFAEALNGHPSEFEFRAANGPDPQYFASCFVPIFDAGGVVTSLMGITQNITERRFNARLLEIGGDVLSLLVAGASLEVVMTALVEGTESMMPGALGSVQVLDDDGRTLRHVAAPSLPAIYGEAVDGIDINNREGSCGLAAATNEIVIAEDVRKDPHWIGQRELMAELGIVSSWSFPIRNATGRVLGTFAFCLSEVSRPTEKQLRIVEGMTKQAAIAIQRKMYERDLRQAKETAEQANEAKSAFLANMSHDLRTPLNSIIGFADMMHSNSFGPLGHEKYEEYTSFIARSGARLLNMVNDILDLSRIESGEYPLTDEVIDVEEAIRSSWRRCAVEPSDNPGSRFRVANKNRNFNLTGDERAVSQILDNLLSNAIKYSDPEDSITAGWQLLPDGRGRLSVEDTGHGISTERLESVTLPFTRGIPLDEPNAYIARVGEGVGLGLHIVKRLAELHGAELALTSAEGAGTLILIDFPAERVVPA
ncbi:MAG: ATP-binding protein, partial [Rhodospirillales bacterium]